MSDETTETQGGWETFSREINFRVAEDGDGRTLSARIVPYNVVARVHDPPTFAPYDEVFRPGAFKAQLSAAHRISVVPGKGVGVLLNYRHGQSIGDVIGRGVKLEDRPDGLYGEFRILNHPDGDKALELINAGDLRGMSGEFQARRSRRSQAGLIERIDARVEYVALCHSKDSDFPGPKAAYAGAEILAVRESVMAEEFEPVEAIDTELLSRLEKLGIDIARVGPAVEQELCETCGQPMNVGSSS